MSPNRLLPEVVASLNVLVVPGTIAASVTVAPRTMPLLRVGADVKPIELVAVPKVWPEPAWKLMTAPAVRVKPAKVRAAVPPPLPADDMTVELPLPAVKVPIDSLDAAPLAPRKLNVPPLSVSEAVSLMRLVL